MFTVHKTDQGAVQPNEYLAAAAGTYKAGQMLNVTGGLLSAIAAASTARPLYLCVSDREVAAGEPLPVTRVSDDAIYETSLSAAGAAVVGGRLQISAGGLQVSAGNGAFEVTHVSGTAVGDMVRGRFV